jgi:hypothetical protein
MDFLRHPVSEIWAVQQKAQSVSLAKVRQGVAGRHLPGWTADYKIPMD